MKIITGACTFNSCFKAQYIRKTTTKLMQLKLHEMMSLTFLSGMKFSSHGDLLWSKTSPLLIMPTINSS
jgi:hypothetical protein